MVVTTFGLILPVELPDKTFIAALVLAARYRPLWVWLGVGAAFFVQTLVAVTAGQLATLLPSWLLLSATLVIFVLGAGVLLRTARGAAGASFLVLFAAEWGDLSQLLTIGQVTRTHQPVSVFVGAWLALLVVSGSAVFIGRVLLRHLRLSLLHYVGAAVCAVFAVVTAVELVRR